MKSHRWQIGLGLALAFASAILYLVLYAVHRDISYIRDHVLSNFAFLPVQVFIWTLITNGLLGARDRAIRLQKLNMVIGTFFDEVGLALLRRFAATDLGLEDIRRELIVAAGWPQERFAHVQQRLKGHTYAVVIGQLDLDELRSFLVARRGFLLGLLESPSLLEHETFTDLLWAVFHLLAELENRTEFSALPRSDTAHLAQDANRAYGLMVYRWLDHMKHLKANYPYLFSLAMRLNPFDREASVIVRSSVV